MEREESHRDKEVPVPINSRCWILNP